MNDRRAKREVPRELTEFFDGSPKEIKAVGEKPSVEYRVAYFPEYSGPPPQRTWRKPIVGPPDRPFAELQLTQRLEQDEWTAAWVHRPGKFIATWEPRTEVRFPKAALELLERIRRRAGSRAGCWDVFAWKNGRPLFMEVKRRNGSDKLQKSQLIWRKAALREGVPESAFQLVEWCGGSLKGRVVRLTSIFGVDVNGWAECRNGKTTFGGPSAASVKTMLAHYEGSGAMTGVDLLWLVFLRNSSGITYCQFDERSDKRRPKSKQRHSPARSPNVTR